MFYNCTKITEIDMTKFDTSFVHDMSEMFSLCNSLNFLNVSNLNTEKVESFENMFFNCTSLTSLNLESFKNSSVTSLSRIFYNCENLEYINLKNFEERTSIILDEIFYNISQNAIICLLSCPPPTNLTITSMSISPQQAEISWEGYEWNKFIISYDLQGLSDPEEGEKIDVIDSTSYIFTNLNPSQKYDIYLKTYCGSKFSYWIGPLLISIESYNMPNSGTNHITTCSKIIYDSGGEENHEQNANSKLVIYLEPPGKFITIKGIIDTRRGHGYLSIFKDGRWGRYYTGYIQIPLSIATDNHLTLIFESDDSQTKPGFQFTIGCIITSSQKMYNLIKENKCRKISCRTDYKNIQNILSNSGICLKNCNSTNQKYHYKGNCYDNCPDNSQDKNFIYMLF